MLSHATVHTQQRWQPFEQKPEFMIKNISEGQAKDMILKYCLEKENRTISSNELKTELFPDFSIDIVNLLIEKIGNAVDPIATVKMNSRTKYIITNGITEMFMQQGGFTQSEIKEKQSKEKTDQKENLEEQIRELTRDNLRLDNWDIRFRWLIAIVTFIIGFAIKYFIDK